MTRKISIAIVLLTLLLGLLSCSSTRLYERWHDESYFGPKLQNILVLGVFKDDIRRRSFESSFVSAVSTNGNRAVAGHTLMPDEKDFDDKEDIAKAVKKIGADAVLITSFEGVVEKERRVPPRVEYVPSPNRFGPYGGPYGPQGHSYRGYYGARYDAVYHPGYTTKDTIVQLETRVYSVKTKKMIWAGKSQSFNTSSGENIFKELVPLVVKDLKENGFIQ